MHDDAATSAAGFDRIHGPSPDSDLLSVVTWGVQTRTITRTEGQMLTDSYLPDETEGWGFPDGR